MDSQAHHTGDKLRDVVQPRLKDRPGKVTSQQGFQKPSGPPVRSSVTVRSGENGAGGERLHTGCVDLQVRLAACRHRNAAGRERESCLHRRPGDTRWSHSARRKSGAGWPHADSRVDLKFLVRKAGCLWKASSRKLDLMEMASTMWKVRRSGSRE